MEEVFENVTEVFPKVVFIPGNSSRHSKNPDYYQIFYGRDYIGIVHSPGSTSSYCAKNKKLEIVDNLKELTRLSEEKCSKLVSMIRAVDY
jgi:hypothetical protein